MRHLPIDLVRLVVERGRWHAVWWLHRRGLRARGPVPVPPRLLWRWRVRGWRPEGFVDHTADVACHTVLGAWLAERQLTRLGYLTETRRLRHRPGHRPAFLHTIPTSPDSHRR